MNGTLSYSWQTSSDNSSWSVVGTNATYTVGASEEGKTIKAAISYKDDQGFDETVITSYSSPANNNPIDNGDASLMNWLITSFPTLSDENQQQIDDFITNNIDAINQASDDTSKYGPAAALYMYGYGGNSNSLFLYSEALGTIDYIRSRFNELLISDIVLNSGDENYFIHYNQYIVNPGNKDQIRKFIDFAKGTEEDDIRTLGADSNDYTFYFYGGNDNIQIAEGIDNVYINLGLGDDYFKGNTGSDAIFGEDGEDLIYGGEGKDVLDGGDDNDKIYGDVGSDLIFGGDGDDSITGGMDDDFIDGGNGSNDIAYYSANRNEYLITNDKNLLTVKHQKVSGDGIDTLVNIESLVFADLTINTSNIYSGEAVSTVPFVDDGDASFSISGTAAVGNTLSIKQYSSDPDGTGNLSYSWQTSSDGNSWNEVSTASTYVVASSDEGKSIKAVISYQDGQDFDERVLLLVQIFLMSMMELQAFSMEQLR